jgi:hypothetical protein
LKAAPTRDGAEEDVEKKPILKVYFLRARAKEIPGRRK